MDTTASSREPASRDAEPDQLHDAQRARGDLNSSIQHDRASHCRLEDDAPGDGAQGVGAGGKDNAADGCVGECTGQASAVAHHRGPRRIRRRRGRRWQERRRRQKHLTRAAVRAVGAIGARLVLGASAAVVALAVGGVVARVSAHCLCAGEAHHHGDEDDAGVPRRGPKAAHRAAPRRESARTRGDDPDAMMPMEPLVATGGGCRGSEPVQTTLPAAGAHETQRGGAAVRGLLSRVFPEPPR